MSMSSRVVFRPTSFSAASANDGLEGVIDTEALTDEMYERGGSDYVVGWRAYVEVVGYGRKFVEIQDDA
jgi:hypothetical protein